MSIINDPNTQQQLASANCGAGYLGGYIPPVYYPPQPVPYEPRKLTVEAVVGGYIINGQLNKNTWRTVAASSHQLAKLLKLWCAQFESKTE